MRVVIATEYGGSKGMGHLTRCTALLQGFNGQADLLLEGEGPLFDPLEFRRCNWRENPDLFSDYDAAIIDSYLAPLSFYEEVAKRVAHPVFIDDFIRLPYPKEGLILNGSVQGPRLPYSDEQKQKGLLGLPFVLLRRPFWDCPQNPLRKEVKKGVLLMGGTDPFQLKPLLERELAKRFPSLEWLSSPDPFSSMLEADIAVSAGGQTLYELARLGTPTVAVGIAENQRGNIEGLAEEGALVLGAWRGEPDFFDTIAAAVESLLPLSKRQALKRGLVDGQGVRRVVERF